jgi:hypothetical protein
MANEQERPSVFGRSFELANGDLRLVDNDFALINGRDNLLQGMQVMIETPFGTDVFNVNYGFDVLNLFTSTQSLVLIKELIRLNIIKSISTDNRIREIREVVFDDDPRFFELSPLENAEERRLSRKLRRRWQAIVVLATVSEGDVVLALDGRGP